MIGARFGDLEIVADAGSDKTRHRLFRCRCICGTMLTVQRNAIVIGRSLRCDACRLAMQRSKLPCDKETRVRMRRCVRNVVMRCCNPKNPRYKDYGGRGIRIFRPWLRDRLAFVKYLLSLHGHDNPELSLDRINVNGHYEPGNLRFTTAKVQANNTRRSAARALVSAATSN